MQHIGKNNIIMSKQEERNSLLNYVAQKQKYKNNPESQKLSIRDSFLKRFTTESKRVTLQTTDTKINFLKNLEIKLKSSSSSDFKLQTLNTLLDDFQKTLTNKSQTTSIPNERAELLVKLSDLRNTPTTVSIAQAPSVTKIEDDALSTIPDQALIQTFGNKINPGSLYAVITAPDISWTSKIIATYTSIRNAVIPSTIKIPLKDVASSLLKGTWMIFQVNTVYLLTLGWAYWMFNGWTGMGVYLANFFAGATSSGFYYVLQSLFYNPAFITLMSLNFFLGAIKTRSATANRLLTKGRFPMPDFMKSKLIALGFNPLHLEFTTEGVITTMGPILASFAKDGIQLGFGATAIRFTVPILFDKMKNIASLFKNPRELTLEKVETVTTQLLDPLSPDTNAFDNVKIFDPETGEYETPSQTPESPSISAIFSKTPNSPIGNIDTLLATTQSFSDAMITKDIRTLTESGFASNEELLKIENEKLSKTNMSKLIAKMDNFELKAVDKTNQEIQKQTNSLILHSIAAGTGLALLYGTEFFLSLALGKPPSSIANYLMVSITKSTGISEFALSWAGKIASKFGNAFLPKELLDLISQIGDISVELETKEDPEKRLKLESLLLQFWAFLSSRVFVSQSRIEQLKQLDKTQLLQQICGFYQIPQNESNELFVKLEKLDKTELLDFINQQNKQLKKITIKHLFTVGATGLIPHLLARIPAQAINDSWVKMYEKVAFQCAKNPNSPLTTALLGAEDRLEYVLKNVNMAQVEDVIVDSFKLTSEQKNVFDALMGNGQKLFETKIKTVIAYALTQKTKDEVSVIYTDILTPGWLDAEYEKLTNQGIQLSNIEKDAQRFPLYNVLVKAGIGAESLLSTSKNPKIQDTSSIPPVAKPSNIMSENVRKKLFTWWIEEILRRNPLFIDAITGSYPGVQERISQVAADPEKWYKFYSSNENMETSKLGSKTFADLLRNVHVRDARESEVEHSPLFVVPILPRNQPTKIELSPNDFLGSDIDIKSLQDVRFVPLLDFYNHKLIKSTMNVALSAAAPVATGFETVNNVLNVASLVSRIESATTDQEKLDLVMEHMAGQTYQIVKTGAGIKNAVNWLQTKIEEESPISKSDIDFLKSQVGPYIELTESFKQVAVDLGLTEKQIEWSIRNLPAKLIESFVYASKFVTPDFLKSKISEYIADFAVTTEPVSLYSIILTSISKYGQYGREEVMKHIYRSVLGENPVTDLTWKWLINDKFNPYREDVLVDYNSILNDYLSEFYQDFYSNIGKTYINAPLTYIESFNPQQIAYTWDFVVMRQYALSSLTSAAINDKKEWFKTDLVTPELFHDKLREWNQTIERLLLTSWTNNPSKFLKSLKYEFPLLNKQNIPAPNIILKSPESFLNLKRVGSTLKELESDLEVFQFFKTPVQKTTSSWFTQKGSAEEFMKDFDSKFIDIIDFSANGMGNLINLGENYLKKIPKNIQDFSNTEYIGIKQLTQKISPFINIGLINIAGIDQTKYPKMFSLLQSLQRSAPSLDLNNDIYRDYNWTNFFTDAVLTQWNSLLQLNDPKMETIKANVQKLLDFQIFDSDSSYQKGYFDLNSFLNIEIVENNKLSLSSYNPSKLNIDWRKNPKILAIPNLYYPELSAFLSKSYTNIRNENGLKAEDYDSDRFWGTPPYLDFLVNEFDPNNSQKSLAQTLKDIPRLDKKATRSQTLPNYIDVANYYAKLEKTTYNNRKSELPQVPGSLETKKPNVPSSVGHVLVIDMNRIPMDKREEFLRMNMGKFYVYKGSETNLIKLGEIYNSNPKFYEEDPDTPLPIKDVIILRDVDIKDISEFYNVQSSYAVNFFWKNVYLPVALNGLAGILRYGGDENEVFSVKNTEALQIQVLEMLKNAPNSPYFKIFQNPRLKPEAISDVQTDAAVMVNTIQQYIWHSIQTEKRMNNYLGYVSQWYSELPLNDISTILSEVKYELDKLEDYELDTSLVKDYVDFGTPHHLLGVLEGAIRNIKSDNINFTIVEELTQRLWFNGVLLSVDPKTFPNLNQYLETKRPFWLKVFQTDNSPGKTTNLPSEYFEFQKAKIRNLIILGRNDPHVRDWLKVWTYENEKILFDSILPQKYGDGYDELLYDYLNDTNYSKQRASLPTFGDYKTLDKLSNVIPASMSSKIKPSHVPAPNELNIIFEKEKSKLDLGLFDSIKEAIKPEQSALQKRRKQEMNPIKRKGDD